MNDIENATQRVDSAIDLIQTLKDFDGNWVFRGQAVSEWELEPGIERLLPSGFSWPISSFFSQIERMSLDEFKRGVHHFLVNDELPMTKLAWLSLMQHHGAPTRLLDFTQSQFVALYFATCSIDFGGDGEAAIWALDYSYINEVNEALYKAETGKVLVEDDWGMDDDIFEKVINITTPLALVIEPFKKNQRLFFQQGTFLLASNFNKRLKDIVFDGTVYRDISSFVKKIVFPYSICFDVVRVLNAMNINSYTIYPGVDGFSGKIKSSMRERIYLQSIGL